jgi:hypothetical protein
MVRPRIADGGDDLHMWRVAANILNKQWRTASKGCCSGLWVGQGSKAPHRMNSTCYDMSHGVTKYPSFLGSTAQLRPWPPPQNPAEFLGGFLTIFFFTG